MKKIMQIKPTIGFDPENKTSTDSYPLMWLALAIHELPCQNSRGLASLLTLLFLVSGAKEPPKPEFKEEYFRD